LSKIFERLPTPNYGLVGHRGAAGLAPENTLSGFQKAATIGLNWVEFDVQCCASGEWVVIHDETLERTTTGQGQVSKTPYEVIKNLDAGSWFHPQFKNERVPCLQEALTCVVDLKIHPNIEIKISQGSSIQKMQSFLKQLQAAWPNSLPPPLISSFDLDSLIILRSLDPELPLGYLQDHLTPTNIQDTLQNGLNSLHCHHHAFKNANFDLHHSWCSPLRAHLHHVENAYPPIFSYAIQKGLPLLAYTVNEPDCIETLLQAGLKAVFSDMTHLCNSGEH
jgi:glycerophosphoryl diester phosphodiesterase